MASVQAIAVVRAAVFDTYALLTDPAAAGQLARPTATLAD